MKFVMLVNSEVVLQCTQALLDSGADICLRISIPEQSCKSNSADF